MPPLTEINLLKMHVTELNDGRVSRVFKLFSKNEKMQFIYSPAHIDLAVPTIPDALLILLRFLAFRKWPGDDRSRDGLLEEIPEREILW